jgi:aspartate ammonia-lyase
MINRAIDFANEERCRQYVMGSITLVTALNPVLGYKISTHLVRQSLGGQWDLRHRFERGPALDRRSRRAVYPGEHAAAVQVSAEIVSREI